MFSSQDIKIALLDKPIDTQFATLLEQYMEGIKFVRVDSEISDLLKDTEKAEDNEEIRNLFKKVSNNENLEVKFDSLKLKDTPVVLNVSEHSRRMEEMMKMYRMDTSENSFPIESTLVVNTSSPLIAKLQKTITEEPQKAEKIASYIYKLTLLSQKKLTADEMNGFISFNLADLNFVKPVLISSGFMVIPCFDSCSS